MAEIQIEVDVPVRHESWLSGRYRGLNSGDSGILLL